MYHDYNCKPIIQELPLARIKKIMKLDEDVRVITKSRYYTRE